MSAAEDRLRLGVAAVLSVGRAAELLPLRDADARALIRQADIVRYLDGREVVVWGDVLDRVLTGNDAGVFAVRVH